MTAGQAKKQVGTKKSARELYGEAFKALGEKKYERAAGVFEKLIAGFPDEQEILARAKIFQRTCQRALGEKGPNKTLVSAEEHYDAGVFQHNNRNYDDAMAHFQKALKSSKDDASHIYYAWAATQVQQGNLEEGLAKLEKAVETDEANRCYASSDPDFEPLEAHEGFRKLIDVRG